MKKISRMFIFSAISLLTLAQFNSGVVLPDQFEKLLMAILLTSLIYYFINPLLKILLLPINILTLGLASFIAYAIIFLMLNDYFNLIKFSQWQFPGIYVQYLILQKFTLSIFANKVFSAFYIAFVISLLESLL